MITPSLGLLCPSCASNDSVCVDSRPKDDGTRRRRWRCTACSRTFGSVEHVDGKWTPSRAKFTPGNKVRTVSSHPFTFSGEVVASYTIRLGANKFVVLSADGLDLTFWGSNLELDPTCS